MKNKIKKFAPAKITYDPSLDAYTNVVLFPKKLAEATAFIEKHGLPERFMTPKKRVKESSKPPLTNLQKELLEIYALEPTDEQMTALKDFLAQLFAARPPIQVEKKEQVLELAA
jgi:hypothetical protein